MNTLAIDATKQMNEKPDPHAVRELTADELDATAGAWNVHWGNSALGFSLTGDGLTVCAAGSCGTIWFK